MIVLGMALLGVALGLLTAYRRKGNRLDMLHYAAGYALAFAALGMVATVLVDRLVL